MLKIRQLSFCAILVWSGFSTAAAPPRVESANQRPVRIALTFDDGFSERLSLVAPRLVKYGWKGLFN